MKCTGIFILLNIAAAMYGISMAFVAYNFEQTKDEHNDMVIGEITTQFKYNPVLIWSAVILGLSCSVLGLIGSLSLITFNNSLYVPYYVGTTMWSATYITYLGMIIYYAMTEERNFQKTVQNQLENYEHDEKTRVVVNNVQEKMQCCGNENYKDWISIIGYIPESCCEQTSLYTSVNCTQELAMKRSGCLKLLKDKRKRDTLIGVSYIIFVMLIQIVATTIPYRLSPFGELPSSTPIDNSPPL